MAISPLWRDKDFRETVQKALSLNDSVLRELREWYPRNMGDTRFPNAELISKVGLDREELELVLLALRSLYTLARRNPGGPEGVIEEIDELVRRGVPELQGVDVKAKGETLSYLLQPNPALDREDELAAAQRSVLPVLENAGFHLDLRVLSGREGPYLAPIVVARFEFDEPVAGSDVVAFQIPDPMMELLESELFNLRALRKQAENKYLDEDGA